jgi:hypothetical protein
MPSETSVSPQDTAPGPGPSVPNTDLGTPLGGYFGMTRRRRVVGNWVEHHSFCVDRVSAARLDRPPRHRIDSRRGRGVARVCGMGAPLPHPMLPLSLFANRNFDQCQSDDGIRLRRPIDGLTLDHALCRRGGGLFSHRCGSGHPARRTQVVAAQRLFSKWHQHPCAFSVHFCCRRSGWCRIPGKIADCRLSGVTG